MHIDASSPAPAALLAELVSRQALAAQHAIQAEAKAENAKQVASLSAWADGSQQAEHIRSLVAITMDHLSGHATPATREHAAQWQAWALSLAEGIDVPAK